jgi:spermidine synthase
MQSARRDAALGYGLLVLFLLSGFAGLIYQSIWSHYLGLTLGHAAYAQTLVLAIFMGGMAVGAAVAGRYTPRLRHLILAYAIIELLIGLAGLLFHPAFIAYTNFSQATALPAITSSGLASAYQWTTATALILPQCVLLGATFPLLSAGCLRIAPAMDGKILGGLYFSNSFGAAIGALAATFVLLPAIGMPGTVATAGWLNILVAVLAGLMWWLGVGRASAEVASFPRARLGDALEEPPSQPEPERRFLELILLSTFLSGAFSFVYEIGWIRLLNQALGTTVHSFELMLAAFIIGLAFGGLWIRNRSGRIRDVMRYVAWAQLLMGVAALLSVIVFSNSFEWVGWMLEAFQRNDEGYRLFMVGSATISMLVMFPAAFFAGMTLPLFTMALLRRGFGEGSIGSVYAANTLGSIAGVLLAVHLLIPLLGVHVAVMLAAIGDVAVGLYLYRIAHPGTWRWTPPRLAGAIAILVVVASSAVLGKPDPLEQVAGVFRTGTTRLDENTAITFLEDGKTATIAVYSSSGRRYGLISTNGKPDASMAIDIGDAPTDDEITMLMAASLPLALHPSPAEVAVIGWGSGLTTHTLLGSDAVERVDSIEIEREMWVGARQFGERVQRAYRDPRSHVIFEDARTWFATGARKYDVIISEPSNPWVSGVASLFTREFYAFLADHLNDNGLLVQWMQVYELSDPLLAQMVAALIDVYPHVNVYTTNMTDLLFVSSKSPIPDFDNTALEDLALAGELRRVGLAGQQDYRARYFGDRNFLENLVRLTGAEIHSDFYPTVSLKAPRDRYTQQSATVLDSVYRSGFPVTEVLSGVGIPTRSAPISRDPTKHDRQAEAGAIVDGLRGRDARQAPASDLAAWTSAALAGPSVAVDDLAWTDGVALLASRSIGALPPEDLEGAWISPVWPDVREGFARDVLAVYENVARRDISSAASAARSVLDSHSDRIGPLMREQFIMFGLLNDALRNDHASAKEWEESFAIPELTASRLLGVRSFLLAWADRNTSSVSESR